MRKGINILLIDDDPDLVREVLPEYGYEVMVAADGKVAIEMLNDHSIVYDLVLLDILVPYINGWEILRYIRDNSKYKFVPVIIITVLNNEVDQVSSLKIGADDYISKPFSVQTLIARMEAILRRALWARILNNNELNFEDRFLKDILTAREKEIITLVAEGASNRKIAERLYLSELTIKTHLKNIFKKLNVSNRTQAIITAINKGIIDKQEVLK